VGLFELFLVGVGLSMDAFAVSICKGLGMKTINWRHTFVIALFFGGFQALMPLIGYLLAFSFATYVTAISHWIAFALLLFIGAKMLLDAFRDNGSDEVDEDKAKLDLKELFMLAIATSIDALAMGISFAFLGVDILSAIALIGLTTFVISFGGVAVGNQFGSRFEKPSTIIGGIVLILIGVKVVLEHYGLLPF
jgi:putative Mn2+ efflux pump MntP